MNTLNAIARPGSVVARPERSEICSIGLPSRFIAMMQARVPAVIST